VIVAVVVQFFEGGTVPPSAGEDEHRRPIVKSFAVSVMYQAWAGSTVIHLAAVEAAQV
jgi:hypothetical protein